MDNKKIPVMQESPDERKSALKTDFASLMEREMKKQSNKVGADEEENEDVEEEGGEHAEGEFELLKRKYEVSTYCEILIQPSPYNFTTAHLIKQYHASYIVHDASCEQKNFQIISFINL